MKLHITLPAIVQKVFSEKYLFEIDRIALQRSDNMFFVLGIILVVAATVLRVTNMYIQNPVVKKFQHRWFKLAATIGVLEVVWFGLRWENVRFFGTHFIALIILVIGVFWTVAILKYAWRTFALDKQQWEKQQLKLKYLHRA